jgi:hypothetical protein
MFCDYSSKYGAKWTLASFGVLALALHRAQSQQIRKQVEDFPNEDIFEHRNPDVTRRSFVLKAPYINSTWECAFIRKRNLQSVSKFKSHLKRSKLPIPLQPAHMFKLFLLWSTCVRRLERGGGLQDMIILPL